MRAAARTIDGVFVVDLELDELVDLEAEIGEAEQPHVELPRVVAAAASGSTVVAVVDRRPPLAVSIDEDNPDRVVYAARNRLYLSEDGGRFWRALTPELPAIEAVAFVPC